MRTAILTDIHANYEAFTACMEHAKEEGAEQFAFLGDLVGYGADPSLVLDEIMEYCDKGAIAVMGNHDEAVVKGLHSGMRSEAANAVNWTRENIKKKHLDFLSQLPFQVERGKTLFVHANAYAPAEWDYVQGVMEATRSMYATTCRVTFCGHVHNPMLYHLSSTGKLGTFHPTPEHEIPLSPQRKWLAIPGSVGQPRDGNPAACYALFDEVKGALSFQRVAYDFETTAAKIRAANLPSRLADRLAEGR